MKGLCLVVALVAMMLVAMPAMACDGFGGFAQAQAFGGYGVQAFGGHAVAVQPVPLVQQRVLVQRQAQAVAVSRGARAVAVGGGVRANARGFGRGVSRASTVTRCGIFGCRTVSRAVVR